MAPEPTRVGRAYAAAYAAHYSEHDLRAALQLYGDVVAAHPGSQEANHSIAQIQRIVRFVVPARELLAAQLKLALAHLEPAPRAPDRARGDASTGV
jgi:hypothetical protein